MTAYILGAGASYSAGYPLASQLLQKMADWLDGSDDSEHWVGWCRNRIVQVRETFGSLNDFESILGKLANFGTDRVTPTGQPTYVQDQADVIEDCMRDLRFLEGTQSETPTEGFYPQYMRTALVRAFREFFYQTEIKRPEPTGYDSFAARKLRSDSTLITFNYDVALERALAKTGKWDIGSGYGFPAFPERVDSPVKVFKLHGSVNWYQHPLQKDGPPFMFSRDLKLLGFDDVSDGRVGQGTVAVNEQGTFILPAPKKDFPWQEFWIPLWTTAADGLRRAEEVFIHGYSIPPADSQAREMLFASISKSATINIHCRGASDGIADEFRSRGFTNVNPFPKIDFETWSAS
jgi:hypothetical protein